MADLENDLMVRVAWLHYIEGYAQTEISDMLNLSRPKVTRLLGRAREKGMVRFIIESPQANCLSVEKELKETFSLVDAVVVPSGRDEERNNRNIGEGGGLYVSKKISSGDLVGISWGRTLRALADSILPRDRVRGVKFVSLAGGLTVSAFMNPFNIGEKLASLFQGQCYYIHAPEVVESPETREFYLAEKVNRKTMEMALQSHYSIVGIGVADFQKSTYIQAGFIDPQDMEIIIQRGGVGDILGQYFNSEGKPLDIELHQRTIAVSLAQLKDMPNVIGLAGGRHKTGAILGALRGRYINVLVTDEATAHSLIHEYNTTAGERSTV